MTTRADAHGRGVSAATHYRTAMIDGVSIFYREADPKDAPVVLLPHGFPLVGTHVPQPDPAAR